MNARAREGCLCDHRGREDEQTQAEHTKRPDMTGSRAEHRSHIYDVCVREALYAALFHSLLKML